MNLRALLLAALLALGLTAPAYPVDIYDWSTTVGDNATSDSTINWAEGQLPSTVNNSARAMMKRVAELLDDLGAVGTVGGTADAITLTSAQGALANGKLVAFKAGGTNTGATTINVNSLGAKAIRRQGDTALSAGDILSGGIYVLRYDTAYNAAAGAWVLLNPQYAAATLGQGKHTIWVPAGSMLQTTTNGCAAATTETTTNDVMYASKDCDAATDEFADFSIQMPKSWDEGTVTAMINWTGTTAGDATDDVIWGVQCVALSNDDALDTAMGTAQVVTDTLITTSDVHKTSETAAITCAGTPAQDDTVFFKVYRDANAAGDNYNGDGKLLGVRILYTTNSATDD